MLVSYIFDNLDKVREVTANFVHDYNNHRPHDSLVGMAPITYRKLNIFAKNKTKTELKAVNI